MPGTTARTVRLNLIVPGPYMRSSRVDLREYIAGEQQDWLERNRLLGLTPWRLIDQDADAFLPLFINEDGGYILSTREQDCVLMVYECEAV